LILKDVCSFGIQTVCRYVDALQIASRRLVAFCVGASIAEVLALTNPERDILELARRSTAARISAARAIEIFCFMNTDVSAGDEKTNRRRA